MVIFSHSPRGTSPMRRLIIFLAAFCFLVGGPYPLEAARTNLWEFDSIQSWLRGDFKGAGLTSDGTVLPTLSTRQHDLPARLVWESESINGQTLVGTSFPAALYLIDEPGSPKLIHKTQSLGITALGKTGGNLYAAVTPSGAIYRYDQSDETVSRVVTVSDSYVWTMTQSPDNSGLLIGTGPDGNLYRLTPEGNLRKEASLSDHNIMDVTFYDGSLLIGTDGGGIYQRNHNGKIRSIYGFDNGEVASITANRSYLYAAVNHRKESKRQEQTQEDISELANQLRQQSDQARIKGKMRETPSTSDEESGRSRKYKTQSRSMMIQRIRQRTQNKASELFGGLSGSIVYRIDPPQRMNVIYSDPTEIVHDLETDGKNLFVATSGKGRLYKVKPDFTRIAYLKTNQGLILDAELEDGKLQAITTGEGGSFYERQPFNSKNVTYRSEPLDAQLLAQWGQLETVGNGEYRVRTRSGNSSEPDTHWREWSSWQEPPRFEVSSQASRYLQFEIKFLKPLGRLRKLDVAFQVPNQRPRIVDLSVSSNPVRDRFIQSRPTSEQKSSNQKPSSKSPSRSPKKYSMKPKPVKKRTVSWKVIDPDGDPNQSRLFYRPIGAENWISFTGKKFIAKNEYSIDLRSLSDGYYRFKLVTTDQHYNDPEYGFTVEKKTAPILVDNTQPKFHSLSVSTRSINFMAKDQTSRIILAQYRVNGGRWQVIWPEDNVFDQRNETFTVQFEPELKSGDLVELRLLDEGGNQALTRRTLSARS